MTDYLHTCIVYIPERFVMTTLYSGNIIYRYKVTIHLQLFKYIYIGSNQRYPTQNVKLFTLYYCSRHCYGLSNWVWESRWKLLLLQSWQRRLDRRLCTLIYSPSSYSYMFCFLCFLNDLISPHEENDKRIHCLNIGYMSWQDEIDKLAVAVPVSFAHT